MSNSSANPPLARAGYQSLGDYFHLTKPTITLLVIITVIPSLLLSGDGYPSLLTAMAAIVGTMLASASAAVFNQIVETDSDQHMERTKKRSLPAGRVSRSAAAVFGTVMLIASMAILLCYTTPMAALTALSGHLFYVLIYTMWLKKRTPQNIVIGGAAGAVGPLIGWAAVSGTIGLPAWLLFLVIFLWTPPHFWSLALKYKDDYARAHIPMYPVVYGDEKTRYAMLLYSLCLLPCIIALFLSSTAGWFFLAVSGGLTVKFIWDAAVIYFSHSNTQVMAYFRYSCLYALGIFSALALDQILLR
jgi:protoheme IX farnesyltransferase